MKKISSKRVLVTGIIFSIAFLSSQSFATTSVSTHKEMVRKHNKTQAQNSGAGCMACHQNEAALPDKPAKKTG